MVKGGHNRVIKKDKRSPLGSRITWICIYYTRVVNQSAEGCDHSFALREGNRD
jgi:hypothetical protein